MRWRAAEIDLHTQRRTVSLSARLSRLSRSTMFVRRFSTSTNQISLVKSILDRAITAHFTRQFTIETADVVSILSLPEEYIHPSTVNCISSLILGRPAQLVLAIQVLENLHTGLADPSGLSSVDDCHRYAPIPTATAPRIVIVIAIYSSVYCPCWRWRTDVALATTVLVRSRSHALETDLALCSS